MRSKDKYMSIPETQIIHCDICGNEYKKIKFGIRGLKENGVNGVCVYCDWLKRHKGIVPTIEGWAEEQVKAVIKFLMLDESPYLNDLIDKYCVCHTLEEVCKVYEILHINIKHALVKVSCERCGKPIDKTPSVFLKNENNYCSKECYWADKTNKIPKGEENPFYKRVSTTCSNCGQKITIIPHNYKKTNSEGNSFHFCSQDCYWKFRSQYYIKEKSAMYEKEYTEEYKNQCRQRLLDRMKRDDRLDTKIQLRVNDLLDELHIPYEREKPFTYYSVDNYLTTFNLIIEVMGDYWHASPILYNQFKYPVSEVQAKDIVKDKQKHSFIKNNFNIEILYLWEKDINDDPEKCKKLIQLYINNNGCLSNFHSFNYLLDNENLKLKENIITPYQDMEIGEYRHLIKIA